MALLDLLDKFNRVADSTNNAGNGKNSTAATENSPHLSSNKVLLGIKSGRFYQGVFRCNRGSHASQFYCYITVRQEYYCIAVTVASAKNDGWAIIIVKKLGSHPTRPNQPFRANKSSTDHLVSNRKGY